MARQVSSLQSLFLSALLFVLTLSVTQLWSGELASTKTMTLIGGAISALAFVFGLILIGNIEQLVVRDVHLGWFEVLIAELVALVVAGSIHGVSVTTCLIFSGVFLLYLTSASRSIHTGDPPVFAGSKSGRTARSSAH